MYVVLISIISIFSYPNQHTIVKPTDVSLKSEINKSIIEGFFENDSTTVVKNTYLMK